MTYLDFRSDFLSRPCARMAKTMVEAALSPAGFGLREDPWQQRLEARAAELLGQEDALLLPTCTMANLVATLAWTRPGDTVLGDATNHLAISEAGGYAAVAGVEYRGLSGAFGVSPIGDWQAASAPPADAQRAAVRLFVLETSHNRGGGNAIGGDHVDAVAEVARAAGAALHLDGSRLFNAAVALGETPAGIAGGASSVAVSLNKGLGAPSGAVLAGPRGFIEDALRIRQRLGGGMRPVSLIASAGLAALDDWPRLGADHETAARLREGCRGLPGLAPVDPPVPTNIVLLRLAPRFGGPEAFCRNLSRDGVLAIPFGADLVRFVTYRDITPSAVDRALQTLARLATTHERQHDE
ncbi:threonine aldolase family protein [Stappia indica]|uniref:L-threonine aldolase n=1 Tax=Stappia indica TaxID=538381 RepID=A0A285TRH4_9HYPH|nr:GntG family PLP-dependent aldolase [Stappia indica]SOC23771.1 L-threonine aldolase [Stappia indica]